MRMARAAGLLSMLVATALARAAFAQIAPVTSCDDVGIGAVTLTADGPPVTILSVSTGTAGTGESAVPYCLVKVLVPTAINIWVGLPMAGSWNGRLQSVGGGGYAGSVAVPTAALLGGYVGATAAAVAACDEDDGVADGIIDEPRTCDFDAGELVCAPGADPSTCLTETEASAVNKIWQGPITSDGRKRLWFGLARGASLLGLAGPVPFFISVNQPRFWVYLDPTWDWHVLDYDNYEGFFDDTVRVVGPTMATDDPDLSRFRDRGGKLILWHGWADWGIMPEGTIRYYERVTRTLGGGFRQTRRFARLFMAPGVDHCGGGVGPQPQGLFAAVVNWVENGQAPDTILATQTLQDGSTRSRPLCPYPAVAEWTGSGSTDDAANFVCARPRRDGGGR